MSRYIEGDEAIQRLEGHTIRAIHLDPDGQHSLIFTTDNGYLRYDTDADCCAETWFADILGVDALLGHTVRKAENVDMPGVEDNRGRQESDAFYGIKITTDAGYTDIVYRCSSNGFYGGWVYLVEPDTGQESYPPPERYQQITQDWAA